MSKIITEQIPCHETTTVHITIIGCGVIGLTTGIVLLEQGHTVEIITQKLPSDTTSAVAAAIWLPFQIEPKDKANEWSTISYDKFKDLAAIPDSGSSMIEVSILLQKEEDAWWKEAIPKEYIKKILPSDLPTNCNLGYRMKVPLIETQLYLNYLLSVLQNLNGHISIGTITDIGSLISTKAIVINCTGLGARTLMNDQSMYAIQGQIVKLQATDEIPCVLAEFTYGEKGEDLAYVVPRKDCLVLGGTLVKYGENTTPDPLVTQGIIERCQDLVGDLKQLPIEEVIVGLRPGRPSLRLERDKNLIHNYGHGGGGFTVSWGCALEVAALVDAFLSKSNICPDKNV